MSTELTEIVTDRVLGVVEEVSPEEFDLDADMADEYGLTSLNKVLLLTSVCDDADVSLSHFTEHDLTRMRSARDIVNALARHSGQAVQ